MRTRRWSRGDDAAVADWMMAQVGLMLAAGVVLVTVVGFTQVNGWQRQLELDAISWGVADGVHALGARDADGVLAVSLPKKPYAYTVEVGAELVSARAGGPAGSQSNAAGKTLLIRTLHAVGADVPGDAEGVRNGIAAQPGCTGPRDGSRDAPFCPAQWAAAGAAWFPRAAQQRLQVEGGRQVVLERVTFYIADGMEMTRAGVVLVRAG